MNRVSKRIVTFAILLLLVPVLVACGPKKVNVSLTSYTIAPSADTVKAGDITFTVSNEATDQDHELVIVSTDLAAGALPVDANGGVDEDQITVVDEVEGLAPGSTEDLTVNLPAGHYVLMCNEPGHYAQGMYLDFTVQ